jgi:hypothetical protein
MALNFGILSQVPSFGQQFAAGQQAAQAQQERNMLRQQQMVQAQQQARQLQMQEQRFKQEGEDRAFELQQRQKQAAQEEQFNKVADLIRQQGMDPDDPKVLGQFAQAAMQSRNPQLVSFVGQMAERAAKRRSAKEEASTIGDILSPRLPPGPPLRQEAAAPNALTAPAPAVNALAAPQQPQNLFAGTPFDIGMTPAAPAKAAAPAAAPAATGNAALIGQLESQRDALERYGSPRALAEAKFIQRRIEKLAPKPLTGDAALLESLGLPITPEGYKKLADMRRQPAPVTNVNVSTERKYGEAFAGKIAEVDINKMTTAQGAPALAESANRIIGLVQQGNLFTGPIADVKLNIARALNVVGVDNAEKIANTERLIAATGQSTLDAIKGAGLGTGQGFTDKDLKFLQGVAGGTINLTPQTLTELATLQHRVATKAADAWNTRRQEMPKDVAQGTGLSMTPITVPPLMQKTAPRPKGVGADWTLMTDKNGARAWVSPDRKQHVEVP